MKNVIFFALGLIVGAVLLKTGVAQDTRLRGMNHVGINVRNYEEAKKFYTETLGLREAYTIRRPDGTVQLTYLQLNRDTFVELIPVGPNQETGITHFGIETPNVQATVTQLRQKGLTVPNPGPTPANAQSSRIRDLDGVQIEVMEFGPESLQRKAMDAWK